MTALAPGEHLCLLYEDAPTEQLAALVPYLQQGLLAGERCIYVADDDMPQPLRAALRAHGVDVDTEEAAGRLLIWTRAQWGDPDALDSAQKCAQIRQVIDEALAAGYSGVRFAVEMTEILEPDVTAEQLLHCEASMNEVFTPELPARIICQYNRTRLPPHAVWASLLTHSNVLAGDAVHSNPYYEAPLILKSGVASAQPTAERVEWMLKQLRLTHAVEAERVLRRAAEQERDVSQADLARSRVDLAESQAQLLASNDARGELLQDMDLLDAVNRMSTATLNELDIARAAEAIVQQAAAALRAQYGAFIYRTQLDDSVEPSFALYGADRDAFERSLPLHQRLLESPGSRAALRIDDAPSDPRFREGLERLVAGNERRVRSYVSAPVMAGTGLVLGVLVFGHDRYAAFSEHDERVLVGIAAVALTALENARLYKQAQDAVRYREQFLGVASHELKTPLTVIKGFAHLLDRQARAGELTLERLPAITQHLVTHADRLDALVKDLLDASMIQDGRLDLRPERVDLVPLCEAVLARFEQHVDRRADHSLVLECEVDSVVGQWDTGRIDQVVTNLVSNALKYSPNGGEIRVIVRPAGAWAEIAIVDHGVGISPSQQHEVFAPFFRANTEPPIDAGGHGLGLHLSAEIVARHGGEIRLKSAVGKGSTFTVRLPLARHDLTAQEPGRD